jgi:hypothetical protein
MNKTFLLTLLFCFFTTYGMDHYLLKLVEIPFNVNEYKDVKKVSAFSKDYYEDSNYILSPHSIDQTNRSFILNKFENTIEDVRSALSFSSTCKTAYQTLNVILKIRIEEVKSEFLFFNISKDFYSLTDSGNRKSNDDADIVNALYLYNACPNLLFLMGKILTNKISEPQAPYAFNGQQHTAHYKAY